MATPGNENSHPEGAPINGQCNRNLASERRSGESGTTGKPICINSLPSRKRKWKWSVQTSNQSKVTEQICSIDVLQDGEPPGGKRATSTRGLYDEARLEGRLLHGPRSPHTLALPPVPLSREPIRVSVPAVPQPHEHLQRY